MSRLRSPRPRNHAVRLQPFERESAPRAWQRKLRIHISDAGNLALTMLPHAGGHSDRGDRSHECCRFRVAQGRGRQEHARRSSVGGRKAVVPRAPHRRRPAGLAVALARPARQRAAGAQACAARPRRGAQGSEARRLLVGVRRHASEQVDGGRGGDPACHDRGHPGAPERLRRSRGDRDDRDLPHDADALCGRDQRRARKAQ